MRTRYIIFSLCTLTLLITGITSCKKDHAQANYNSDKTALQAVLDSLTNVYNNTKDGYHPGDYSVGSRATLDTALVLAGKVITSNSFTQREVDNALNSLRQAGEVFSTHLLQDVSRANLVGYWTFNGSAVDSSGNGHDGVPQTGLVGSSAAAASDGGVLPRLTTDRFGAPNMAYEFNNGATVRVPYSAALNPQAFTISLWVKRYTTNAGNYMFSLNRWLGYKFQLQSNNFLFLTVNTSTGDHDQDDSPGIVDSANVWRHVAVSYIAGTMKFYIQGEPVKTAIVTGTPVQVNPPVDLAIGNELPKQFYNLADDSNPNYFYGASFFIGALDDIRFYNTVLTDAEVLSIYTSESHQE